MPINRIKGTGNDLVDVEELTSGAVNIDGKKALVVASELFGRVSTTQSLPMDALGGNVDAQSQFGYGLKVINRHYALNGTTWDRWRNNNEGTLLASAARTASIYSTTQTNYNHKGIYIILRVTAKSDTPSITMALQIVTATAGVAAITATGAAITTVGTYILALHPALVDTAGVFHLACDALLPRSWRLQIVHADTDSITYSVDYVLMV